jgi:hypothetical protein
MEISLCVIIAIMDLASIEVDVMGLMRVYVHKIGVMSNVR